MRSSAIKVILSVFLGWYLLVPPYGSAQSPLSRWHTHGIYDSAEVCYQHQEGLVAYQFSRPGYALAVNSEGMGQSLYDATLAQCFASNDPRLKE